MGEYLAGQGYTVLGIRLAGHATHPEDMIRSRWTDWVASVEDGYHVLRGLADRIYLIGLSMGGALSLLMSTQLDVSGVVAISTPLELPGAWRLPYTKMLSKVMPYMPKPSEGPSSGWFDEQASKDHISYPQNPVRSISELGRLLGELRRALPQVRVPVLLIHSQDDTYIVPANMQRIYSALTGVQDKSMLMVKQSGHVVTRDSARTETFEATAQFLLHVESQSR